MKKKFRERKFFSKSKIGILQQHIHPHFFPTFAPIDETSKLKGRALMFTLPPYATPILVKSLKGIEFK
ncbi:hypothetical protein ACIGHG_12350 [Bacillus sp. NPDC077411]|uniref:hypothetical protein n=1 Tax=Bacillus sp. NPDC077411 TaxID=3363947 RepID=UPI0037C785E9